MSKINEVIDLMQKICNISISVEDLQDLTVDVAQKQRIVDSVDSARCATELSRIKQIMKMVDASDTMVQGGRF